MIVGWDQLVIVTDRPASSNLATRAVLFSERSASKATKTSSVFAASCSKSSTTVRELVEDSWRLSSSMISTIVIPDAGMSSSEAITETKFFCCFSPKFAFVTPPKRSSDVSTRFVKAVQNVRSLKICAENPLAHVRHNCRPPPPEQVLQEGWHTSVVGATVGLEEVLAVGTIVGANEGINASATPVAVGDAVGASVCSASAGVGTCVGAVGECEGNAVGAAVGAYVSPASVGDFVGTAIRAGVGNGVGLAEGENVGAGVGVSMGGVIGAGVGVAVSHVLSSLQIVLSQSLPIWHTLPTEHASQ